MPFRIFVEEFVIVVNLFVIAEYFGVLKTCKVVEELLRREPLVHITQVK